MNRASSLPVVNLFFAHHLVAGARAWTLTLLAKISSSVLLIEEYLERHEATRAWPYLEYFCAACVMQLSYATPEWKGRRPVWDAETGKLMLTLPGHAGKILTASFSPDSTIIRTAGLVGSGEEGLRSIRVLLFDTPPASQTFRKYFKAPPRRPVPNSGR